MPYTTNPHLPRLRMQLARRVIKDGWSTREVAKYSGYNQSTIARWVQEAKESHRQIILTKSSRPHHHPDALPSRIVQRIVAMRLERDQCAEVLHHRLSSEGMAVSLSSVKRVIKRYGLTYPSPWKKWHKYLPRPLPEKPGLLVQIDSMWDGQQTERLCAYALIDVCSRWAYVEASQRISTGISFQFVNRAREHLPFSLRLLQSDHGSEFAKWFTKQLQAKGIDHRHSRVRRPTDNGYVERFIRTLQQECLSRTTRSLTAWKRAIPDFLNYYNTERPHMGLNMRTPLEVMRSY